MSGRPLFSLESLAEIAEDPEQTAYFRIDSPRSVDAMRRLGVADGDLWYLPPEALTPSVLEARQKKLTPKQRKEFAQMRFEKRERTRTDLLTKLLKERTQVMKDQQEAQEKMRETAIRKGRPASAVSVRDIERRRLFVEDRLHKKQHLDRKLRTEQEELAAEVAEKADKAAERRRHIEHVRGIAKEVATDSLRRRQTALNLLEYKWPTENEKRLTQMSARLPKSSLRIDVDRMSDYQRDFKDREEEWLKTHSPLDTERLLLSKLQEQKQKMNESRKLQTAQATQRGARTRGDSRGAQTTRGGTRALPDSANPLGVSQQAPTAAKTSLPTAPPEKAKSMKADPNANRASQSPRPSRRTVPRIPLLSLQDHESLRTALTLTPSTRLPTPGVVYANNYYEALAPTPHKNVRALPLPADDITLLAQSPDPPPASPRAGRRTYGAYRLANTEAVHGRDGDRERRSTSSRRLREKETNGQPSPPTADLGASAKETTLQLRPTRAKGGEKERETQSKENVDSPRAKEGGSKKGDKDPSRVLKTSGSMRARKYAPEKGGGGTGAQAQPQSVPVA
uniref:Uncharacterized protein n=1 Tax=Chromera velia CCMP2878 TaxID=1169474 RepID=A0A0G4HZ38_9ALVE|eukprot:Cvel_9632.t1-p1 / transcript=Cvel_9632.t1 / gene=Cvel_9632 / organism=Chromera_velia_CCMP2878 / gene_product=hypothetical protein / transcript_product=hypothetical protein / location=Cvel_scaffold560:15466-24998(-) / protein_length=565 / sequence_SO=supercontig / SO=protein_coding / is_pseudo=false